MELQFLLNEIIIRIIFHYLFSYPVILIFDYPIESFFLNTAYSEQKKAIIIAKMLITLTQNIKIHLGRTSRENFLFKNAVEKSIKNYPTTLYLSIFIVLF